MLMATACLLQLPEVVEACSLFLVRQLHPSNCLGIRLFADSQSCNRLLEVAHTYIAVSCQFPLNDSLLQPLCSKVLIPISKFSLKMFLRTPINIHKMLKFFTIQMLSSTSNDP